MNKLKNYAPAVVRIGVGLVVLWFGLSQLSNPNPWFGFLPSYVKSLPVSSANLIFINGLLELVLSLFLILGFYTRLVAALVTLHIAHIVTIMGYGAIGVRDFGLCLAALSVFFQGDDIWCVDRCFGSEEKL